MVDPSAVLAKDYQPTIILTIDGRVLTGILKKETPEAVTIATANEIVIVPRVEIEELRLSETSMMPDNLWKPLDNHQIRSLRAYLASPRQVDLPAGELTSLMPSNGAPESPAIPGSPALPGPSALPGSPALYDGKGFFNGKDLTDWKGDAALWTVEQGEIVGTSPGIQRNSFLVNDKLTGDFDLTVEVKLSPNKENSGIQFRSVPLPGGEMRGYQADMGAGWWGKLYEESGRGILAKEDREQLVNREGWNTYRIRAQGHHVQTWLNDKPCVDIVDEQGALKGQIAVQIHSGGPMTVRFRKFHFQTGTAAPDNAAR